MDDKEIQNGGDKGGIIKFPDATMVIYIIHHILTLRILEVTPIEEGQSNFLYWVLYVMRMGKY